MTLWIFPGLLIFYLILYLMFFDLWPPLILPEPSWAMFAMITLGRRSRTKIEVKSFVARISQRGLSGSVVIFSMYISPLKECSLNIWFIRTKIYVWFWNRSLVNTIEYEHDPKFFLFFFLFPHFSLHQYIFLRPLGSNKMEQQEHRRKLWDNTALKDGKGNLLAEEEIEKHYFLN